MSQVPDDPEAPPAIRLDEHTAAVQPRSVYAADEMRDPAPSPTPRPLDFEQLVAQHRSVLEKRARQLCRRHFDPDDLLQDALFRALQRYGSLRKPETARSWLISILSRTFFDLTRQRSSQPPREPLDEVDIPDMPPEPEPIWSSITGDQLRAAVERLPADLRDCYRMHALEGHDYSHIAATLKIPIGTVGTRLLRARKKLRELLLAKIGRNAS
jgi:RNA polymerase sigma-70 factor (ECF subfamily)